MKILIVFLFISITSFCQSENNFQTSRKQIKMQNYIINLYDRTHFEGVKMIKYRRKSYIVCTVTQPYGSSSDMALASKIRAGGEITSCINAGFTQKDIYELLEDRKGNFDLGQATNRTLDYSIKVTSKIQHNTSGFLRGLQCLSVHDIPEKQEKIYIYFIQSK